MEVAGSAAPTFRARGLIRFGVFEVDLHSGDLRKNGLKVRLTGQPFQVLAMLLQRPGEVVTREDLEKRLWPADTFVDFDHSLNTAINKIREALGDDADNPRFIETLHRRGYRFIAPVDESPKQQPEPGPAFSGEAQQAPFGINKTPSRALPLKSAAAIAALFVVALLSAVFALNLGGMRDRLLSRPAQGQIESIAVLPFENAGNDPDAAYLSDGLAESLIDKLSQLPGLRVVPRGIAFQYKGKGMDAVAAGRELHAQVVLTGRVVQVGDQLSVAAELTNVSMVSQVWGKQYNQKLSNIFEVEENISRDILGGLRVRLNPNEAKLLNRHGTENSTAYQLVLRSRFELVDGQAWDLSGLPGSLRKALEDARQAAALDPNYAEAYAVLAETYLGMGLHGGLSEAASHVKAREAALRAVKLDESLPAAHAALCKYSVFAWSWEEANKECLRAVELGPDDGRAHLHYAWYLYATGRLDDALAEGKKAMKLDPSDHSPLLWMAEFYIDSHRFDDAIEVMKTFDRMEGTPPTTDQAIALALFYKGMHKEAIEIDKGALASGILDRGFEARLAWMYSLDGQKDRARKVLAGMDAKSVVPFIMAEDYAMLGDKDQAFAWLEKAFEQRDYFDLLFLRCAITYESLRSDPRYKDLLRRMNFPDWDSPAKPSIH
jgi:TolB-like protein/DNA-binding winged helix-turn-helix (wHTH) protein